MWKRIVPLLVAALMLVACGHDDPPPGKRFPMEGTVKALDTQGKVATIDAGRIKGWMEPMTMGYPVKPDSEFAKLKVGDRIQGTVVVAGDRYYLTDVKIAR